MRIGMLTMLKQARACMFHLSVRTLPIRLRVGLYAVVTFAPSKHVFTPRFDGRAARTPLLHYRSPRRLITTSKKPPLGNVTM